MEHAKALQVERNLRAKMGIEFKMNVHVHYGDTSSDEEVYSDGDEVFHIFNKQGPLSSKSNPTCRKIFVLSDEEDDLEYVPNSVDPSFQVKGKRVARVSMSSAKGKTKISGPPSVNLNKNSSKWINVSYIDWEGLMEDQGTNPFTLTDGGRFTPKEMGSSVRKNMITNINLRNL